MNHPLPNPYAAPAILEQPAASAEDIALRRVRASGLGLLILSGMMSAFGVLGIPAMIVSLIMQYAYGVHLDGADQSLAQTIAMFVMFVANYFIFYGAWQMRSGRRYRWAYAAALLATLPVTSPLLYFGIPFGIWSLVVLHRKDVQEAFANKQPKAEPNSKG